MTVLRLCLLFVCTAAIGESQRVFLEGFDAFVEQQRKSEKVSGVAVAVADRNGVILTRGYGSRDAAGRTPVTPRTIFQIASATKAFTAVGLATLVDQGTIDWDTPVQTYLPGFRMSDSYAAEHITLRDLLSHRSGIPRYDGVWVGASFPQSETVRRLRFLPLSAEFRSTWQYSNLNFAVAAYLQGQVDGGLVWEESEKKRVTNPLGMASTTSSLDALRQSADHALPYADTGSGLVEVPFMKTTPVAGAGAINSNAEDMSHFLQMLVNRGKFGVKTILSEKRFEELTSPTMVIPWKADDRMLSQYTYGLGWFLTTYRSHRLAWHWGSAFGYSTIVAFLPDDGFGIAVFCNRGNSNLPDILAYNFFDRALGLPLEDWAGKFRRKMEQQKKSSPAPSSEPKASAGAGKPSHPLGDYAGSYHDEGYGTIVVQQEGKILVATFNSFKAKLEHAGFDVFKAVHEDFNPLSDQNLQFRLDVDGKVDAILWDVEAGVPRATFVRAPEK